MGQKLEVYEKPVKRGFVGGCPFYLHFGFTPPQNRERKLGYHMIETFKIPKK